MNGRCIRSTSNRIPSSYQTGLTLIELLVAMVVGLFLVGGVATMYFSTFQSYRVLKQNAEIAQRERLAATYIGAFVQSAGYYNQPALKRKSAFPGHGAFSTAGQFLAGTDGTYPDPNNQSSSLSMDTLQLRMRLNDDGHVLNCLGENNSTGTDGVVYTNKLALDSADQQLECTLVYEDPANSGATVLNKQPLLNGVASLEFTYGVDTDGNGSADQYLAASDVADWLNVRSIIMNLGFAANNATTGSANTPAEPVMFRAVFPVRIDF